MRRRLALGATLPSAAMLSSRVTVPIPVVLTTLDETPQHACPRVTRFLTRRLRTLVNLSEPEGLWTEYGDEVSVV